MNVDRHLLRAQNLSLVLISLFLMGCIAVLLYITYTSQMRIQYFALDQLRHDAEKRAGAVSYFYMERRNDLKSLAEKRALSNFFENQALGMSLKYGLGDSLFGIAEELDKFLDEKRLGGKKIYTRVLFMNNDGTILTDRAVPGAGECGEIRPPQPRPGNERDAEIRLITDGGNALVAVDIPYYFKQVCVGRIIACLAMDTAYDYLLRSDTSSSRRTLTVTDETGRALYTVSSSTQDPLRSIERYFGEMIPGEVRRYRLGGDQGFEGEVVAVRMRIQDTPLYLASLAPVREVQSGLESAQLLALLATICLLIFGGMILITRINTRKFVLQARLDETARAQAVLEEQNELLQKEISERLVAEESLRNSEERFTTFMSHLPAAVFIKDQDGRLLFANQFLRDLFDWQDCVGKSARELLPLEAAERMDADDRRALSQGLQVITEPLCNAAGVERVFETHKFPVHMGRSATLLGGIALDVTERKQAEERLRESEERFRALSEATFEAIFLSDGGTCIGQNLSAEKMFGYSTGEALGRSGAEWITPEYRELVLRDLLSEDDKPHEARALRKDGTTFPCEIQGKMITYGGQRIRVTALRDITERKAAEEILRWTRFSVEQAADPIYWVGPDGRIIYANEAACRSLGYTKDELTALSIPDIDPIFSMEQWPAFWKESKQHPRISFESAHRRKDGTTFPIEVNVNNMAFDGREFSVAFVRNISERKQAEDERKALESRLKQAQKMEAVGTLAGGIAHDFNNVLAPIIGYTELALGDTPELSPMRHDLDQVLKAAYRARDLVKQILAFSRRGPEQQMVPMDVGLVVKEVLKLLRASLPSTIEINQSIQSGMAMADATQIHQIVVNLCTNAAHAMGDKGILDVSLAQVALSDQDLTALSLPDLKQGPYLKLSVADTGHGMDADTAQRIFEPYFTTKEVGKGTGLGLAVVHGIVKRHGGEIRVGSEPGKGSVFDVYIPMRVVEAQGAVEPAEALPGGSERILLVDDEQAIAVLGARMLERLGYRVTAKTNAHDALDLFRSSPREFDLIITDYTMPNMTGIELAREMIKIRPGAPIILCTGFSDRITSESVKEYGISELALKPLDRKQLAKMVRNVLGAEERQRGD